MRTLADLAQRLNLRGQRGGLPTLVLLTDARRLPDPLPLLARLPVGAWVILRHPDAAERLRLGRRLAPACRTRRLTLLVAGDLDLAIRLGIGLHLPEVLARNPGARLRLWVRRRRRPLCCAAHSRLALRRAALAGATAALLSPVFPTLSHPGAKALGPLAFRRLTRRAAVPVYALGGVDAATALRLAGSRAAGVAAIGGLASGQKERAAEAAPSVIRGGSD